MDPLKAPALDEDLRALAGLVEPVERAIRPNTRRLTLRGLPAQAPVIRVLAARDFRVKFKQSLLGPLWLVFQPLALLAAFLIAFKGVTDVDTGGAPYILFALAGLTVWSFFQAAMTLGTSSLITSYSVVRYTPCPRLAFPIAAVIASLPALAVTGAGALIATVATGNASWRLALIPLGIVWGLTLTCAIVAMTAALAVRVRDVIQIMPFLLQVLVFVTPVGYPASELNDTVRTIVELNPLTGLIEMWRWMLIDGAPLSSFAALASAVVTLVLVIVGWRVFARTESTIADVI